MNRAAQLVIGGGIAFLWPMHAYAQRIPDLVLILGLMPVLALVLSVVLAGSRKVAEQRRFFQN